MLIFDVIFAFHFLNLHLCFINDQLCCTDVVVYTTVPVASRLPLLCIFTNLEVQGRYLPIIRGTGTSGDSTPRPGGGTGPLNRG